MSGLAFTGRPQTQPQQLWPRQARKKVATSSTVLLMSEALLTCLFVFHSPSSHRKIESGSEVPSKSEDESKRLCTGFRVKQFNITQKLLLFCGLVRLLFRATQLQNDDESKDISQI